MSRVLLNKIEAAVFFFFIIKIKFIVYKNNIELIYIIICQLSNSLGSSISERHWGRCMVRRRPSGYEDLEALSRKFREEKCPRQLAEGA